MTVQSRSSPQRCSVCLECILMLDGKGLQSQVEMIVLTMASPRVNKKTTQANPCESVLPPSRRGACVSETKIPFCKHSTRRCALPSLERNS